MECDIIAGLHQTQKGHLTYEPNFNKEQILTISPTKLSKRIVRLSYNNNVTNVLDLCSKNEESDNCERFLKESKNSRHSFVRNDETHQNIENIYCTVFNNERDVFRKVTRVKEEPIESLISQFQEFDLNNDYQTKKEEYLHRKEKEFAEQATKLHSEALRKLEQMHIRRQKMANLKNSKTIDIETAFKASEEYNNLLEHHKRHSKLQNAKKTSADLELKQQKNHELYKSKLKEQYGLLDRSIIPLFKKENFYAQLNAVKFDALLYSIKEKMLELQHIINLNLIKDDDASNAKILISQINSLLSDVKLTIESDEMEHEEHRLLQIKNDKLKKLKEMAQQQTKSDEMEHEENRLLQIKKEKSTDCDSALIPLLGVHG